ncbi:MULTISPECIES: SLC13 family permease [unclassified Sinorhizobium]|uniref:SLC13 family permease n=1 Tax=unclassified Sinorhizobium TaxID=2613772 RepID=UPI0024C29082|nr:MULTISPECIES: SLC13 family permease [unclassified Sinorhizobium]MDK1374844.1 SLC13 family permease [Sinorhizobium sp. 6-70]MDK1479028.1 SLC13 family permease [Sinorhizobium sp. 6-117]
MIVLTLLGAAIVMFAINRPRLDAVALMTLVALPFTGVVTMGEALAGFSDPNIVLIAALFVLGEGLVRTGVAQRVGDWLIARAGKNELRLIVLLMMVVGALGATMSSTAVTAIFIPVALRISQSTGIGPGRLMMPLSVAALISGMMTLVATAPNLIVNGELERHGVEGFGFFSFTPFGLPILLLGTLYMSVARRWLQDTATPASSSSRPNLAAWIDEYKLADREHRLRITAQSPLAGRTLEEFDLSGWPGANIVALERGRRFAREVMQPSAKAELKVDDVMLIDYAGRDSDIRTICERFALEEISLRGADFADRSQEIGLAQVVVAATSDLAGQTIADAELSKRFNLTVIGLRRGMVAYGREFLHEPLAIGDMLLLIGPWRDLDKLRSDGSPLVILNMAVQRDKELPAHDKAVHALACLALVVGLMVSGVIPNVQAALIGCLLMGVLRCIDFNSAYRSIDWKTIVLIVGMLPFSIALERTGGVEVAADSLRALTADTGPHVVLGTLFVITALLGMFISNTATAVLMAPVALAVAQELGASPYPFAMIVALAASTAFMTPVSSPVNALVVGPGHYTFGDFVRIGVPFSLIVLIVSVVLVPWLLPL